MPDSEIWSDGKILSHQNQTGQTGSAGPDHVVTRLKNIKNVMRLGIADPQKEGKQGRDDSIKQFSTQLHPTYVSLVALQMKP